MAAKNLWGDLSDMQSVRTPVALLIEQSEFLTNTMEGVLVGRVHKLKMIGTEDFIYDFDVVVPNLNDYIYTLLRISHPVELYPVDLSAAKPPTVVTCENEKDLEEAVSAVLSSAQVKAVISSLLAQAET